MSVPHQYGSADAPKGSTTHIDDTAQGSNGIGAVNGVAAATCVLHNCARDHDDVLGRVGQLLDDKVDHLAEARIFVLEQLRDAEEEGGGFGGGESLARVEEEGNLGQQNATSSRLDGRAIE